MADYATELYGAETGYPYIPVEPDRTEAGTAYLRSAGVHLIARPVTNMSTLGPFLSGFGPALAFGSYLEDPVDLAPGSQVCKTAGQLCYLSFGPRRTMNGDADRYFANIRSSGHGSVMEHASFSMLLYGVSRSLTHELVRHRAGFAYSQVSQRYVSGQVLRFVERPEFQSDPELHAMFEARIDRAAAEYARLEDALGGRQGHGEPLLGAGSATDRRKKLHQAARSVLPNETEAPIIATANVRAWRHFIEMRATEHAEIEIRNLAVSVYRCLSSVEPLLFADYVVSELEDGTLGIATETPGV